MYNLTKKEKLDFILKKVAEKEITAYEIGKKTGLNVGGIEKILKKTVKNPQEKTLNTLIEYLESKVLGSKIEDIIHKTEEPKNNTYMAPDQERLLKCLEESNEMLREINRLQSLLRKHNIEYEE